MTDSSFDWIKLVTLVGGVVAFVAATVQYGKSERWKRLLLVTQEIRAMKSNRSVINVSIMLDWTNREVCLFPEAAEPKDRYVQVSQAAFAEALKPQSSGKSYSRTEQRIRDDMDVFLDYLELLWQFAKHRLVKVELFKPLLAYWIELIRNNDALGTASDSVLWRYIIFYKFTEARDFLVAMGLPAPTGTDDASSRPGIAPKQVTPE